MKELCPECRTAMKKKAIKIDLPRGSAEVQGFECQKCGEEMFTHDQAVEGEKLTMSKGIWGPTLWLERKVTTIGNSTAIVIPKDIAKQLKLRKGEEIKIGVLEDEIIIKPVKQLLGKPAH